MHDMYDLVIVGGGPGGIAAAVEGTIFKVGKILMIEKSEEHSHTIRRYYKDKKRVDKDWQGNAVDLIGNVDFTDGTKESTLVYFDELLDNDGIGLALETNVEKVTKDGDIFEVVTGENKYNAKNVIIAIGRMGKPNKPSYRMPRAIRSHISFSPYDCKGNEKILVVGGGDSAVEYACDLAANNDVTITYRRDSFVRANATNKEMIEEYDREGKLEVKYSTNIDSLDAQDGRVKANYAEGFEEVYDRILYALGGTTPVDFLRNSNIDLDNDHEAINDEHCQTSVKGLYISGDIVSDSAGTIAAAFNHSYLAVKHMTSK